MKGTSINPGAAPIQQPHQQPPQDPYPQSANQMPPNHAPIGSSGHSLRAGLKRFASPLSSNNADKFMTDLMKAFREEDENIKNDPAMKTIEFNLIPIPRNSGMGNGISVLTMVLGANGRFAYHSLLLAADAKPFREESQRYEAMQQPVVRAPSDFADDYLMNIIRQKVAAAYQSNLISSADCEVVPADFNLTDKQQIKMLFNNAWNACWHEILSKQPDYQYLNLTTVATDQSAVARTSFNQDQSIPHQDFIDAAGNPIRTEWVVDLRTEQKTPNRIDGYTTENATQDEDLGCVQGFINLTIDPVAARLNPWGAASQMRNPNETQEYVAELVITGVDMNIAVDLANTLLMISTVFPLLNSNEKPWLRNFMPRHLQHQGYGGVAPGRFNPRDIGALNYDYGDKDDNNLVNRYDTTDVTNFQGPEFYGLMYRLIREGIAVSIDVPECADSTWITRVFAECNKVPEAEAAIVKAADALTNNRFSFYRNQLQNKFIMVNREDRIINGFFMDETGVKHDLREIDMLYLLNKFGHEDGQIARRWAATFGAGHPNTQMIQRLKLLESVGQVFMTGFSRRMTFNPEFLMALDRGIADTGFRINNEIGQGDMRSMIRPSAGLAQANALMTNFASSTYNYTASGPQGGFRPMAHVRQY